MFRILSMIAYNPVVVETKAWGHASQGGHLEADPLPWLLEPANPSARYLTLRHVLGRSEDDPDTAKARAGILEVDPAAAILAAQWPDGFWVAPDRGYTPRYRATVWQIMFLAQLGAPLDERIERACEFVWQHSRRDDRLFTPHKRPRLGATSAGLSTSLATLNGNLLLALSQLGWAGDLRVSKVLDALAALDLTSLFRADHVAAVVKLAGGLQSWLPRLPPSLRAFLEDAAEFLAGHLPTKIDDQRSAFSFPLAEKTDLIEILTVLQQVGAGTDPRLGSAIDLLVSRQDQQGRWSLAAAPGKMWASFGEPGRPNKWVTVRALRVLRAFSEIT